MSHAENMSKNLTEAEQSLKELKTKVVCLEEKSKQERKTHATETAHMKDNYEQLRGRVLRRLKEELSLLEEGLYALQRDPPKVHVMVDHADRAIGSLKREMEKLRESL